MENFTSPLQKYKRQPKLFIDLPSKGAWYSPQVAEKFEELEVYSMSASDEIAVKTPDALITGNAVVNIIQNCIPEIKNAWGVVAQDFEYLLAAIRIASYGDNMNVSHKCSKCGNEDNFGLPLQTLLDHLSTVSPSYDVHIEGFTIRMRPLTYKETIENQLYTMKVRRELSQTIKSIDDNDERDKILNGIYERINKQTEKIICEAILEISTPDGETENNPVFVKDFILNNEGKYFSAVQKQYAENNKQLAVPKTDVSCSECENKDSIAPILDYSSFFLKP